MKLNKPIKSTTLTAITILAILGAFGTGIKIGQKEALSIVAERGTTLTSATSTADLDLAPFWKSLDVLNSRFVATTASSTVPSNKEKVYGAISGLAASYGDPYTTFFPPKESEAFKEEVRGDFEGIGMEIAIKDSVLTVVAPLKGTPAEKAGLKPGDQIIKINKTFTTGVSVEEAIKQIRGPRGTTVTLTVKKSDGSTKDIIVTRDIINIPTIDTKLRDDGVFVISLYTFSANSASLFRDALREFILSGSDKLILDLRGNPGGYLESAVDMASFFLPAGKTIVIEDSGSKVKQQEEKSRGYNVFNDNLKMAILIDQGSASASEILAGALHEHGVAKLVGEKSFGKGSVQELVEITPDTALKVTIAKWLTPNGHSISQNGLEPDVKVAVTKKDIEKKYDAQMEKAAQLLLNTPNKIN